MIYVSLLVNADILITVESDCDYLVCLHFYEILIPYKQTTIYYLLVLI